MIIELYRGLIDILVSQNIELEKRLTDHIRPFHEIRELEPGESGLFNGYWNFLLEICMIIFSKIIFAWGIVMVTMLAIIFFPLDFLMRVASFGGRDGRLPEGYPPIEYNEPKMENEIPETKEKK